MKNKYLSWLRKMLVLAFVMAGVFVQMSADASAADADFEPAQIELKDGEYAIEVELEGGTGRATVTSPATLIVKDGLAYAQIEWSSSKYDYMLLGEEKYLPLNKEGNSVFEIPITVFDEPMTVIADTTAMSVPHEVEYTLAFHMDTITSKDHSSLLAVQIAGVCVLMVILVCGGIYFVSKRKRKQ